MPLLKTFCWLLVLCSTITKCAEDGRDKNATRLLTVQPLVKYGIENNIFEPFLNLDLEIWRCVTMEMFGESPPFQAVVDYANNSNWHGPNFYYLTTSRTNNSGVDNIIVFQEEDSRSSDCYLLTKTIQTFSTECPIQFDEREDADCFEPLRECATPADNDGSDFS
uniref:Putative secreted protein n=1 Tax=Amblyomma triste TaxID=251400 RepID=A0A023G559_AMBTT